MSCCRSSGQRPGSRDPAETATDLRQTAVSVHSSLRKSRKSRRQCKGSASKSKLCLLTATDSRGIGCGRPHSLPGCSLHEQKRHCNCRNQKAACGQHGRTIAAKDKVCCGRRLRTLSNNALAASGNGRDVRCIGESSCAALRLFCRGQVAV